MAGIRRRPGTRYAALVPNDKGAVRAVDAGVDAIHTVRLGEREPQPRQREHDRSRSRSRSSARWPRSPRARRCRCSAASPRSFGCPFEGDVPVARLNGWWRAWSTWAPAASAWPTPPAWRIRGRSRRCSSADAALPRHRVDAAHARHARDGDPEHPGRDGARRDDTSTRSIGGLGGCPFAPGASGNVCTEDLVHCLHAMGVATGIDLDRLIGVSRRVEQIVGRALPGQIIKAGPSTRRYPVPDTVAARRLARA